MLQLPHKSHSFIIAFTVYSMEIVLLGGSRKGVLKLVSAVIEQGVKEAASGSAVSFLRNAFIKGTRNHGVENALKSPQFPHAIHDRIL